MVLYTKLQASSFIFFNQVGQLIQRSMETF